MATKSEIERLAVVEQEVKDINKTLVRIETKVDDAIKNKADKSALRTFKWITLPVAVLVTAVITGLVGFYLAHRTDNLSQPQSTSSSSSTSRAQTPTASSGSSSTPRPDSNQNGGIEITLPKVIP